MHIQGAPHGLVDADNRPNEYCLILLGTFWVKEQDLAEFPTTIDLQQKGTALALLDFVADHPACCQPIKDRAAQFQARLEAERPSEVLVTARARAENRTLTEVVAEILDNQDPQLDRLEYQRAWSHHWSGNP